VTTKSLLLKLKKLLDLKKIKSPISK